MSQDKKVNEMGNISHGSNINLSFSDSRKCIDCKCVNSNLVDK